MTKKILIKIAAILFTIFLLFSCSTKHEGEKIYYIIKHYKINKPDVKNSSEPPPPPPVTFYGDYNFILIDTHRVFYHKKHIYYTCMNGMDSYDPKPPKINLSLPDLSEIELNELARFLADINDSVMNKRHFFASISSPTDTIKNRAFKIISDFLKSRNLNRYIIRNWTEEEEYVTTAKMHNVHYDYRKMKWKIGFDGVILPSDTTETK